ncbi:MAG: hypothetical protein LBT50_02960 [Prevotellaceae bacterium]|jgi:3-oxoacyl-[acyl-carrier-protein] synthase-1|nr:hypothetical protein [Prevotellaceae bacterium]
MYPVIKSHTIIHPLGFSTCEVFDSIVAGRSGLKEIRRDFLDKPVFAACFSEEQNRRLELLCPFEGWNRFERLIWLSGKDVLEKASITLDDKVLFIVATTKGGIEDIDHNPDNLIIHSSVKKVIDKLPILGGMGNREQGMGNLHSQFPIPQTPFPPVYIISNACISGLSAIIAGKRFLETQDYDYVVIIGADTVNDFVLSGFNSLFALSDQPCKPFDKARNGINLGEGAAAIVLHKTANINDICLTGGAITNDANHISGPSRTGNELAEAIKKAVKEANNNALEDKKFDFLSAHGTATIYNDEMECKAFVEARVQDIPIHSLKPYVGHTLGAAGVLESVICIESLVRNILIPSIGYSECGTSDKLNIQTKLETKEMNRFIKTMSGFGGCNAAICFEKK